MNFPDFGLTNRDEAFLLLLLGLTIAVISGWKAYKFDDEYPQFGDEFRPIVRLRALDLVGGFGRSRKGAVSDLPMPGSRGWL